MTSTLLFDQLCTINTKLERLAEEATPPLKVAIECLVTALDGCIDNAVESQLLSPGDDSAGDDTRRVGHDL